MTKYMHTINGRPATFDGYQICYANFYGKPNQLRDSLAEIRKDQATTKANRLRDGYDYVQLEYSHLRYV